MVLVKNRNPRIVAAKPQRRIRPSPHTIAELTERYPEVQLATLVDAVPEGTNWIHEIVLARLKKTKVFPAPARHTIPVG